MGIANKVQEGVYTMLGGPNFETPAELKMLKMCGVDAVGRLHPPGRQHSGLFSV
jgi:purine-nucleoside phosphorylase